MSKTYYLVIDDNCEPSIQPLAGTPVPPIAQLQTGTVMTNGSNLNLRKDPSENAEVLARMPMGSQIVILDSSFPGWYHVKYNNIYGYASNQWITPNDNGSVSEAQRTYIQRNYGWQ